MEDPFYRIKKYYNNIFSKEELGPFTKIVKDDTWEVTLPIEDMVFTLEIRLEPMSSESSGFPLYPPHIQIKEPSFMSTFKLFDREQWGAALTDLFKSKIIPLLHRFKDFIHKLPVIRTETSALVIGAHPTVEGNRTGASFYKDEEVTLLDHLPYEGPRYIDINFYDVNNLTLLAHFRPGVFDEIMFDKNVIEFFFDEINRNQIVSTPTRLKLLTKLLKKDGIFIIPIPIKIESASSVGHENSFRIFRPELPMDPIVREIMAEEGFRIAPYDERFRRTKYFGMYKDTEETNPLVFVRRAADEENIVIEDNEAIGGKRRTKRKRGQRSFRSRKHRRTYRRS